MFLVDNWVLKIILLVGLICTVGIGPSTALKCHKSDGVGGANSVDCSALLENATCKMTADVPDKLNCVYGPYIDYFCKLDGGKTLYCGDDPNNPGQLGCCCNTDNCNDGTANGPKFKELCEYKKQGVEQLYPGMVCPKTQEEIDEEERIKKEEEEKKQQEEEDKRALEEKRKEELKNIGLSGVYGGGVTGLFESYCGVLTLAMLVAVSICCFPLRSFF